MCVICVCKAETRRVTCEFRVSPPICRFGRRPTLPRTVQYNFKVVAFGDRNRPYTAPMAAVRAVAQAALLAVYVPLLAEYVDLLDDEADLALHAVAMAASWQQSAEIAHLVVQYLEERLLWHAQHPGSGNPLRGRRFSNRDSMPHSLFLHPKECIP